MSARAAGDTTHPGSDPGLTCCPPRRCSRGPLAVGLAYWLRGRVHSQPGRLALAALAGLGLSMVLWPVARAHGHAALVAAFAPESVMHGGDWRVALGMSRGVGWRCRGCGPALAWAAAWLMPPTLRELEERSARRQDRRLARLAPRERPELASAVALGERVAGDAVLPSRGRELVLPLAWLARHALVLGASGSGKTETLLRIAHEVALRSDWTVLFIDGKGDRETMRRFHALMLDAGRRARLFPDEGYDGWRGSAADVAARLVEVIDFAQDGPAAYYRDQAVNLVRLACEAPAGPPRSAGELLERLDLARCSAPTPAARSCRRCSPTRRGKSPRSARGTPASSAPSAAASTPAGRSRTPPPATCSSTGCASSTRPPASRASSSRTSPSTRSSASRAAGGCC